MLTRLTNVLPHAPRQRPLVPASPAVLIDRQRPQYGISSQTRALPIAHTQGDHYPAHRHRHEPDPPPVFGLPAAPPISSCPRGRRTPIFESGTIWRGSRPTKHPFPYLVWKRGKPVCLHDTRISPAPSNDAVTRLALVVKECRTAHTPPYTPTRKPCQPGV